jgi:uncharacterized protein
MKLFPAHQGHYFLCNAITGEIMILSDAGREVLEIMSRDGISPQNEKFAARLKEKSFLFESAKEEEDLFSSLCQRSWEAYRKEAPSNYIFIVNTYCNFSCPYCFEPEAGRRRNQTFSDEKVDAAFQFIDEHASRHPKQAAPSFELFGGEPLLHSSKKIVAYLLECISGREHTASIQTNGYFLSWYLDLIADHSRSINSIQITLDGPPHIHDKRRTGRKGTPTFFHLVKQIEQLLKIDFPFRLTLRTNVDSENIDFLEDLAGFYDKKGWLEDPRIRFVAAPVDNRCGNVNRLSSLLGWDVVFKKVFPLSRDSGGGPFDLSVFKPISYFRDYFYTLVHDANRTNDFKPKVIYCEAAASKLFAFHPDSHIYPCPESVGRPDLAIGSYFPEPRMFPGRIQQWREQTILKRKRCHECGISTFCGGGCVLSALMHNDSMELPICDEACETIEAYLSRLRPDS